MDIGQTGRLPLIKKKLFTCKWIGKPRWGLRPMIVLPLRNGTIYGHLQQEKPEVLPLPSVRICIRIFGFMKAFRFVSINMVPKVPPF